MSTFFFGDGTRFDGNIVDWRDIQEPKEKEHAPKYIYRAVYNSAGEFVKSIPCLLYMRRGDRLYDDESRPCTFKEGYTCYGTGFEEADEPADPDDPDSILWICYPKRDDGSMEATASSGLVFICRDGQLAPFIQCGIR